uniref:AP-3 complex subunit delta n=1 Tax=Lygus hesperus TaxID=30085 RepID=A0A0A9W7B7_LYGHE
MRITAILLVCAMGCMAALAQDYQEAEDRRSKLRSPRGPVIPNRALSKNQLKPATSTTTPEPPPAEGEGEAYDEFYDEEQGEPKETTTTSTEAPKKGIRGGVVRPFRSNTDLIESLKRRRAQIANERSVSTHSPPTSSTYAPEPTKASSSNRQSKNLSNSRKFSRGGASERQASSEQPPEEESTPKSNSRLFAGRGRRF